MENIFSSDVLESANGKITTAGLEITIPPLDMRAPQPNWGKELESAGQPSDNAESAYGSKKVASETEGALPSQPNETNNNNYLYNNEPKEKEFSIFEDGTRIDLNEFRHDNALTHTVRDAGFDLEDEFKFYAKESIKTELPKVFDKNFTFSLSTAADWDLPSEAEIYVSNKWKIKELKEMKIELNTVKNKLNNYELDEWHYHTRFMNRSGNVSLFVNKSVQTDLYNLDWCKFYEICSGFNLVSKRAQENGALNSLHLCEEPGCFITSLNHYLKLNYPDLKWDWLATSLNPYYEGNAVVNMMNDDRLIFHTLDHWVFGNDYTGDVMNLENLQFLMEKTQKLEPILLVTADGSINCQNDPDEQELAVSKLTFYEIATALSILSEGGNFIIKMFTMFEEETICIMYILACAFECLIVSKPTSSKEGNSEVFVICLGYTNCEKIKNFIRKILIRYESNRAKCAMFPFASLPRDFLRSLRNCAQKFKNLQTQAIERNIKTFGVLDRNELRLRTSPLKNAVAAEFIKRYGLKELENGDDLILGSKLDATKSFFLESYIEIIGVKGSLNERIGNDRHQQLFRLQKILRAISGLTINWKNGKTIWTFAFPQFPEDFKMIIGKSVESIGSSRFCSGRFLRARNEVLSIVKHFFDMEFKDFFTVAGTSKTLSFETEVIIKSQYPELLRKEDTIFLNFNGKLWNSLNSGIYEQFEKNAFFDIANTIDKMENDQNLIIEGFPLLTQFTVGIIYLLGHSFEKVGFVRPTDGDFSIILFQFRKEQYRLWNYYKLIKDKMETLKGCNGKTVLSVVPITDLIGKNEELFLCISAANGLSIQDQIRRMIHKLKVEK